MVVRLLWVVLDRVHHPHHYHRQHYNRYYNGYKYENHACVSNERMTRRGSIRHVHLRGSLSLRGTTMGVGDDGDRLHRAVGDLVPPDPDSLASRDHLDESVTRVRAVPYLHFFFHFFSLLLFLCSLLVSTIQLTKPN